MASLCNSSEMTTRGGLSSGESTKAALLASTSISTILSTGSGRWHPQQSTGTHLNLPPQLQSILDDVDRAFGAKLYYPALLVALTLPDICIALSFDKEKFVKDKDYAAFIDTYTTPAELGLGGQDCYRLRGGVVHRGNAAGHPFFGKSHVIFTVPETGTQIHALSIQVGEKSAAMFSLALFLQAMIEAVKKWYLIQKDDPQVRANLPNLLSWYPNGLSPFVGGAPIVGSGA